MYVLCIKIYQSRISDDFGDMGGMASNIPFAPGTLGPPRQLLKELLKPWTKATEVTELSNEKVPMVARLCQVSTSTLWMNHDEPA